MPENKITRSALARGAFFSLLVVGVVVVVNETVMSNKTSTIRSRSAVITAMDTLNSPGANPEDKLAGESAGGAMAVEGDASVPLMGMSSLDGAMMLVEGNLDRQLQIGVSYSYGDLFYSYGFHFPSSPPTFAPSESPTPAPSPVPSISPIPSQIPLPMPSPVPTILPTSAPTSTPTPLPTTARIFVDDDEEWYDLKTWQKFLVVVALLSGILGLGCLTGVVMRARDEMLAEDEEDEDDAKADEGAKVKDAEEPFAAELVMVNDPQQKAAPTPTIVV